jgi:hypothetical protein
MKRALSLLAALAIAAALAVPAGAAAKPNISDPLGDANFINDQGTGDGSFGDVNPADAGTVSDLTDITIRNDKKNVYVEIGTEAAPPAITAIGYTVRVNPDGTGGSYCIHFEAMFPGANNVLTEPHARLRDACTGESVDVEVLGTTIVVPRKASKAFAKGATLKAPQAQSYLWSGDYPNGVAGPYADTTKVGTDFKFKG